jgi:hypothetical protein
MNPQPLPGGAEAAVQEAGIIPPQKCYVSRGRPTFYPVHHAFPMLAHLHESKLRKVQPFRILRGFRLWNLDLKSIMAPFRDSLVLLRQL